MTVTLIAAVGRNGVIGRDNDLPWRTPDGRQLRLAGDLARFKRLTTGRTVVMGRRTFDSIGRALPDRRTVVITRRPEWTAEAVVVVHSLADALAQSASDDEVYIAGGGQIYRDALPLADRLELTEVDQAPDGDTFFPAYDNGTWLEVAREPQDGFAWVRYERR